MSDTARALGLQFEDDYRPPPPRRWSQPWSSPVARTATIVGAFVVGLVLTSALTAGREAAQQEGERKAELIALVGARQQRAEALSQRLEELRGEVTAAEQSVDAGAARALNARLSQIEATTGLTGLRGPGVQITFSDATGTCSTGRAEDCRIQDVDLQLATNILWQVGAEAVAVNGERMIATTAIRSAGSSVLINYQVLTSPYVVEAIGEPTRLADGFATSQLAEDFEVWRDVFGLGYTVATAEELVLPPYRGSVQLRTAVDPEAEVDP